MKTIQCESLLAKWHWDDWMSTCKRMKLDPILVNSGHQDRIPRLGGLNNGNVFSVLEAESPISGCRQGQILVRALLLT